jgi:competence protein ComEA
MDYIKKYWFVFLIVLILCSFQIYFMQQNDAELLNVGDERSKLFSDPILFENQDESEEILNEQHSIIVDVKGEVNNPNVYEISKNSRIKDVIILAGGFTNNADQTSVNLAQKVVDEMVIYVPKEGELPKKIVVNEYNKLININYASKEELETLPGIGPSKAASIINYREENGYFKSIDELNNVPGIGLKLLDTLRSYITLY